MARALYIKLDYSETVYEYFPRGGFDVNHHDYGLVLPGGGSGSTRQNASRINVRYAMNLLSTNPPPAHGEGGND